jgi:muconolactone delta-isomerase
MEFLVTMTTRVPAGTTDAAVDDVRQREAAHSRKLAAEGSLLRLWRPPLRPGEWRTLGLFAATDAVALEEVLASMPLRVWRTDVAEPLFPHPNDPGSVSAGTDSEFFVESTCSVPDADQGQLLRLWRLEPGPVGRTLGLWNAVDTADLEATLARSPLSDWAATTVTPLSRHPSDPATQR